MRKRLIPLLLLTSCFSSIRDHLPLVQSNSPKRYKERIADLQKRLQAAAKEQKKAEEEVQQIGRKVQKEQLALIKKEVDEYERKMSAGEGIEERLFDKEREMLHEMIGTSPYSAEAQNELDRILRIITELRNR